MKVSVDTNNPEVLKKPEFKPLEPGIYTFEISNDLAVTTSKAGKPMIEVQLVCVTDCEGKGTQVRDYVSLTPEARQRYDVFACLCKACGIKEDAGGEVDLAQFKGIQLKARVIQEAYKVDPTTKKAPTPGYTGPTETKFSNKVDEYLFTA
jgi:hypothetical protein